MTLSHDPLDILLKHDHWGTKRLLEVCATLSPDQFHARFDIGPGCLHDTLAHVIGAMRRWADRIAQRSLRPSFDRPVKPGTQPGPDVKTLTPAQLLAALDESAADLAAVADLCRRPQDQGGLGLDSIIEVPFGSTVYRFTRGVALVHVLTHGTHHRAQCLNMLRRLGLPDLAGDGLPEVAAADWQAEVETGQLPKFQRRTTSS